MKILYCLAHTSNSGGMERIVVNKANWLAQKGHEVTILTTDQENRKDFFSLIDVKRIDSDILYSKNKSSNPIKRYILRNRLIKEHKNYVEKYIKENPQDVIISTFGNEVGFIPKLKDKSKKILEIHFSRWFRLQENRKGIWNLIDRILTWKDFRYAKKYDHFVCLTEEDKQNWKGISNIHVINNFIKNKSDKPASLQTKSMIAVGRLEYQKGYERLIEAWELVKPKHPDWKLEIYGSGTLKNNLVDLIKEKNLSDVIRINDPIKNIEDKLQESSAFILSSRYEGFGLVLIEAMSNGLPIISFDCQCGPKDLITNENNGFIIKEGDTKLMADRIIKLIENPCLRIQMGENAYKLSEFYLQDTIMPQWENLFNS